MVMRERRAQTAILETARGGILRRGIAVSRAKVAVVTNVSSDHFGEYGIDDLEVWSMSNCPWRRSFPPMACWC